MAGSSPAETSQTDGRPRGAQWAPCGRSRAVYGLAPLPFTGETSFPRGPPSGFRLKAGVSLLSPSKLGSATTRGRAALKEAEKAAHLTDDEKAG